MEFHKITDKRITPTTHRTIRENIAIKTEVYICEMKNVYSLHQVQLRRIIRDK